jgi:hypothetical protein
MKYEVYITHEVYWIMDKINEVLQLNNPNAQAINVLSVLITK